ncbi:hypothetical protein OHA18_39780 [Kribbella sp. NBC_00709]|uniref:hypothetical protein n=1 Tax=Kribbella sp. NBC_00709 TaxID=2975972 RepID=UPI002E2E5661|nr:hypothetical protein [Kribbella sp. NBC_00709]
MSFLDLTPTWTERPLTDPAVAADVVDLMISLGDRHRGTFSVVLCDPDDHYRATVMVDLPSEFEQLSRPHDTGQLCSDTLRPLIPAVQTAPGTGVILALGRPGPLRSPESDREWADAGTAICQAAGLRLLGFYVAARDGVYQPLVDQSLVDQPTAA